MSIQSVFIVGSKSRLGSDIFLFFFISKRIFFYKKKKKRNPSIR